MVILKIFSCLLGLFFIFLNFSGTVMIDSELIAVANCFIIFIYFLFGALYISSFESKINIKRVEQMNKKIKSYKDYKTDEDKFNFYAINKKEFIFIIFKKISKFSMYFGGYLKFNERVIDVKDIKYFMLIGDVGDRQYISGGGGSSITGAIVGNMIAGPTGAIIGSRKSNNPISVEYKTEDYRKTFISLVNGENIYLGYKCYELLLTTIPKKEYNNFISKLKTIDK